MPPDARSADPTRAGLPLEVVPVGGPSCLHTHGAGSQLTRGVRGSHVYLLSPSEGLVLSSLLLPQSSFKKQTKQAQNRLEACPRLCARETQGADGLLLRARVYLFKWFCMHSGFHRRGGNTEILCKKIYSFC